MSETLYPRAVKNTDGTWSLVAGSMQSGFVIIIAGTDVTVDEEWAAKNNFTKETLTEKAVQAYVLGYDAVPDTFDFGIAEKTDTGVSFKFASAGTPPDCADTGVAVAYAIQASDDNETWVEVASADEPPVTLAFASAKLYNRLVATFGAN